MNLNRALIATAVIAPFIANAQPPRINVYDGFETGSLSAVWDTNRFAAGSVTMQSEIVRSGRGAARVTLRKGEKFEAGMNGSKDTERAELLEASKLVSRENVPYEYSFSQMIPADFPIVPVRLVIAQWKQYCNGDNKPCSDNSPVVAVRYVSGTLRITMNRSRRSETLYTTTEELRGKWTDFRFRIRFTPASHGILQAWINGKQVVDYKGATAYPEDASTGYANPSQFYFKMGLYRDVMDAPMTLYIDEYRKQQLPE
ncbi:MAG: heparin lyase I family protein [Acidobacteria bacterium]|nr:heparin lyase I family protein [Acidobacteriota bacterium]